MLGLPDSLYARIMSRLARYEGEVYPFHIGETHLLPTPGVMQALRQVEEPAVHHYGHPAGLPELREALAETLTQTGMPKLSADDLLVTHGATHGLNLVCQAILDPGDVMLVLSPHWPLINAMVHAACAVPVEVPFSSQLRGEQEPVDTYALLSANMHRRVRAIYVTSPNNPDGVVLRDHELEGIARFCVEHDVYAVVDEAYDRFHFCERQRRLSAFEGMADRTITVFTFSKSHRMAGLRVGYTAAPADVRAAMVKLANISIYNVSLLTQRAALAALTQCAPSVEVTVAAAKEAAVALHDQLADLDAITFQAPEGGAYIFADLGRLLDGRECFDFLDYCLDRGVVFAPGAGFGAHYKTFARFCFTTMDPAHLARAGEALRKAITSF